MDDLLREFIAETNANLTTLSLDLIRLEQMPDDRHLLSGTFRLMHTLKTTCAFLNLSSMETLALHCENMLGAMRDGNVPVTPKNLSLMAQCLNAMKKALGELAENGSHEDYDTSSLIDDLDAAYDDSQEAQPIHNAIPDPIEWPEEPAFEEQPSEVQPAATNNVYSFTPVPKAPVLEEPEQPAPVVPVSTKSKILLVDDSPFFRNMLAPLLKIAGYDVTALESPIEALAMRADGQKFDAIVSDIEMPAMNGFEFARKVREESSQWKNIPLFALTSNTNVQNADQPPTFNKYVSKFDRDDLLNTLTETLAQGARA